MGVRRRPHRHSFSPVDDSQAPSINGFTSSLFSNELLITAEVCLSREFNEARRRGKMPELLITRAVPNPAGKDRTPANTVTNQQLNGEWIEFTNSSQRT